MILKLRLEDFGNVSKPQGTAKHPANRSLEERPDRLSSRADHQGYSS